MKGYFQVRSNSFAWVFVWSLVGPPPCRNKTVGVQSEMNVVQECSEGRRLTLLERRVFCLGDFQANQVTSRKKRDWPPAELTAVNMNWASFFVPHVQVFLFNFKLLNIRHPLHLYWANLQTNSYVKVYEAISLPLKTAIVDLHNLFFTIGVEEFLALRQISPSCPILLLLAGHSRSIPLLTRSWRVSPLTFCKGK